MLCKCFSKSFFFFFLFTFVRSGSQRFSLNNKMLSSLSCVWNTFYLCVQTGPLLVWQACVPPPDVCRHGSWLARCSWYLVSLHSAHDVLELLKTARANKKGCERTGGGICNDNHFLLCWTIVQGCWCRCSRWGRRYNALSPKFCI